MRKLKLIVLIIAILLIQGLAFGDEIVEKEGNTTKIKLLDEEDNENSNKKLFENSNNKNKYDTLLGNNLDEEETANYYMLIPANQMTLYHKKSGGSSYDTHKYTYSTFMGVFNNYSLSDGTKLNDNNGCVIKDSNQNLATISNINKIKMTQDREYYYFDVDLSYKSENTLYNPTKLINSSQFQSINNGSLYLSNMDIDQFEYNYTGAAGFSRDSFSHSSAPVQNYSNVSSDVRQSLTFNYKTYISTQKQNYNWVAPSSNSFSNTINNFGINVPSEITSSYTYPYETLLNNAYTPALNKMDSFYTLYKKALFLNSQPNQTQPRKPEVNDVNISNINITKDITKNYWNNNIKAKIKIKKSELENYKYLNMYAPTAVYVHYEYHFNEANYNKNTSYSGSYTREDTETYSQGSTVVKAKSVHSEKAIDLSDYINCEHEWYRFEIPNGDKVNHIKKCKFCEWEINEPHELTCEYDGYTNNLCHLCGYTDNVVIDIYADDNQVIQERIGAFNSGTQLKSYTPYPTNFQTILDTFSHEKTGYLWKGYKTIQAKIPVSKESYSSIKTPLKTSDEIIKYINEFPPVVASKSTILQLNYEPIEYYIELQSETNKGTYIFTTGTADGPYLYDKEYPIPSPSISGEYSFVGWSKTRHSDEAEYTDAFKNLTATNSEIIKLYPVLDEKHYKFKFSKTNNLNINLATYSNISDLKCYFNTNYTLPNNINVDGYEFKGWSLTESGNNIDFIPNATIYNYTNTENTYILYPVYEPHKYIFNFSQENILNLNVGQLEPQTFNYGEEMEIKDNYIVSGYVLKGWSLKATSSEIDFIPNQKIFNYTSIDNKNYTLYPIYEEIVFRIIYNTDNGTYSNGLNSITKDYTLATFVNFEMPNISKKYKYKYGKVISEDVPTFISYKDTNNNDEYKTINPIKEYIYNNNVNNQVFNLHYNYSFVNYNIGGSGNSGGSGGGGGSGNSGNSFNKDNVAGNNIDKEQYSSLESSNILNNINGKSQKKKKDIVTFLNEIYDDWKEQNNLNIKRRFDIIDLIKAIYEDFSNKHD